MHLVTGDFNLHHPLWEGERVERSHLGASLLLDIMLQHQLELGLSPGTITREKGVEASTLDLTLSTSSLYPFVHSSISTNYAGSDHLPIVTTINLEQSPNFNS